MAVTPLKCGVERRNGINRADGSVGLAAFLAVNNIRSDGFEGGTPKYCSSEPLSITSLPRLTGLA